MFRFPYRDVLFCALFCALLALAVVKGQSGEDDDDESPTRSVFTGDPFVSISVSDIYEDSEAPPELPDPGDEDRTIDPGDEDRTIDPGDEDRTIDPDEDDDPPPTFPIIVSVTPPPSTPTSSEDLLRAAIVAGNVDAAAAQMNVAERYSVGGGLRYSEDLARRVVRTPQRNTDPDVVAFKAVASSMLQTRDASKLSAAIAFSFIPDCACSPFLMADIDELTEAFQEDLLDLEEMQRILAADAALETFGRKLKAHNSSPTSSFICAYCWPADQCKKMHWC